MKRIISMVIAIAVLISIAIPVGVNAASKVSNVKQTDASTSSVTVSWDALLTTNNYVVEISDNPNSGYVNKSNYASGHYTIYGLTAGRTYYVRISGYINSNKDASTTSTPIAVATAPTAVNNLRQTSATTSSVTVKWDKSTGATKYYIYERSNNQDYYVGSTTSDSYTIKKLSNKVSFPYYIYVRAIKNVNGYDAGNDLSYYNHTSISPYNIKLIPAKPAKPKVTSYLFYSEYLDFAVSNSPFRDGYQFKLYKGNSKKAAITSLNNRSIKVKKNQFYKVRVRDYTTIGNSKTVSYGKWSKYSYACLGIKDISATSKYKALNVSWSKVKGATSYTVYVSDSSNGVKKKFATTKKTSIKVTKFGKKKLASRKYYYVYITANKKVGKTTYKAATQRYVSAYTK